MAHLTAILWPARWAAVVGCVFQATGRLPHGSGQALNRQAGITDSTQLTLRVYHPRERTGASEPRNMGYMTRLGLWGEGNPAFRDFGRFLEAVQVGEGREGPWYCLQACTAGSGITV